MEKDFKIRLAEEQGRGPAPALLPPADAPGEGHLDRMLALAVETERRWADVAAWLKSGEDQSALMNQARMSAEIVRDMSRDFRMHLEAVKRPPETRP